METSLRAIAALLADPSIPSFKQTDLIARLGHMDTPESVKILGDGLHSEGLWRIGGSDKTARAACASALGRLGTEDAIDTLIDGLRAADAFTVGVVAVTLRELDAWRAIPALVSCLENRGKELGSIWRGSILKAFARMPDPREVDVVRTAAVHDTFTNRMTAAYVLALIGTPEAREALEWGRSQLPRRKRYHIERALRGHTHP